MKVFRWIIFIPCYFVLTFLTWILTSWWFQWITSIKGTFTKWFVWIMGIPIHSFVFYSTPLVAILACIISPKPKIAAAIIISIIIIGVSFSWITGNVIVDKQEILNMILSGLSIIQLIFLIVSKDYD